MIGIPGAKGDGSTNDAAALVAASNKYSEIWLPESSRYYIGTSITINSDLRFISGAQFIIGNGVTLTLGGHMDAPLVRCFVIQGTGTINLGPRNSLIPCEWFGAIGDWNNTTGTDNRVAMQQCLDSIYSGQMLLQGQSYLISGEIFIRKQLVGIKGTIYGLSIGADAGPLRARLPVSRIVTNNSSTNMVSVYSDTIGGGYNVFEDFSTDRVVPPTGTTATGITIYNAGGWILQRVMSCDHIRCFFFTQSRGSYGSGIMDGCLGFWGLNGFDPPTHTPVYGVYHTGNDFGGLSFRLHGVHIAIFGNYFPTTSYGFYIEGKQINDFMLDGFETAKLTYGVFFNFIGPIEFASASDIHLRNTIVDEVGVTGIHIQGITNAAGGAVNIRGGWISGWRDSITGIRIQNCQGISINDVQILTSPFYGMQRGIEVLNSNTVTIQSCNILGPSPYQMNLENCSLIVTQGNLLASAQTAGPAVDAFIRLNGTSNSAIHANVITGTGTNGIVLSANSNNNSVIGTNLISPSISTPVVNNGTNNKID